MDKIKREIFNIKEIEAVIENYKNLDESIEKLYKDSPVRGQCILTKVDGKNNKVFKPGCSHRGYCFGIIVGLACSLEGATNWFTTSVVKSIDWENKLFNTLNSTYHFEFTNTKK